VPLASQRREQPLLPRMRREPGTSSRARIPNFLRFRLSLSLLTADWAASRVLCAQAIAILSGEGYVDMKQMDCFVGSSCSYSSKYFSFTRPPCGLSYFIAFDAQPQYCSSSLVCAPFILAAPLVRLLLACWHA
jgi:hypothetical protein